MKKPHDFVAAAIVATLSFLAACGTPASLSYPPGATLKITKNVWGYYQEYLTKQGGVRKDGALLVVMVDRKSVV